MQLPSGLIAGMDETGRGSWAGPVLAAAVILHKGCRLPGLKDSKLLNSQQREKLYAKITQSCPYGVGLATQEEVDASGLLHATFLAFSRALEALPVKPDYLLVDGRDHFHFPIPHEFLIRGDQFVRCISAASILAKVSRDRLMVEYAHHFPQYGFDQHKGYGTLEHQAALRKHGPCALHRQSYAPLIALKWPQESFL